MATKVVIRHPDSEAVAVVSERAAQAHVKRGWVVLDAKAPKDQVLAAAEALGRPVADDGKTREAIVSELTGKDATTPDDPTAGG